MSDRAHDERDEVRLTLPCVPAGARVVRRTAVAVAELGVRLSPDARDDLRLLVHELVMILYDLGVIALDVRLRVSPAGVSMVIGGAGPTGPRRADPDVELARAIAGVIADDVRIELHAEPPLVTARVTALPR